MVNYDVGVAFILVGMDFTFAYLSVKMGSKDGDRARWLRILFFMLAIWFLVPMISVARGMTDAADLGNEADMLARLDVIYKSIITIDIFITFIIVLVAVLDGFGQMMLNKKIKETGGLLP